VATFARSTSGTPNYLTSPDSFKNPSWLLARKGERLAGGAVKVIDIAAMSEFRHEAMWRKVLVDKPDMYVSLLTFEPGQELKVHKHPDCDIWLYVVVGDAYVHSGDEEKVLRAGQGAFIPPDTWHGIVNESDTPTVVMSIQAPKAKYSDWRDIEPGECPECGYRMGHPTKHDHCPMCDIDLSPLRI